MLTEAKLTKETNHDEGTWYEISHRATDYTFPVEALIHVVWFDRADLHVELTDGRKLSIPLWWIPTLHDATPTERANYVISQDRKMIVWDPDRGAINEELRIEDYLGPCV